MTQTHAVQRLIDQENLNLRYSAWGFFSGFWLLFSLVALIGNPDWGSVVWGIGYIVAIINIFFLAGTAGPRGSRIVMAILLAAYLSPIITWAAVEIARDAGLLTKVRVKQAEGTWKLVAKRYAAPYMRD